MRASSWKFKVFNCVLIAIGCIFGYLLGSAAAFQFKDAYFVRPALIFGGSAMFTLIATLPGSLQKILNRVDDLVKSQARSDGEQQSAS